MRRIVPVLVAALLPAAALAEGDGPPEQASTGSVHGEGLPTASFRLHHREFLAELTHLDRLVERLPAQEERRRGRTMLEVVAYLDQRLRAHAVAEERALYPAVDARAGGREPFTAAMRQEHRIIERWIDGLDREAHRERPDPRAFARQANRLLGLVSAHFELEEEVLLPVLDRTMTAREFQEEVADRMGPLHETLPASGSPADRHRRPSPAGSATPPPPPVEP